MSTTNLKLATAAKPAPARTPARAALASAIAKRDEAQRRVDAFQAAQSTARQNVWKAQAALEDAQAAVESSKRAQAKFMAETALGQSGPAPMSIAAARLAVQTATDELECAEAAFAALGEESADFKLAQSNLDSAKLRLDNAVRAVVASDPVTAKMLHRARMIQRELAELSSVLYCLGSSRGGLPDGEYFNTEPNFHNLTLMKRWAEAEKRLAHDADTPLPELPAVQ